MILVRSPLRITLGGGATDLQSYAQHYGGFSITAAIDRYVYVAALRPFDPGIYLKYSKNEFAPDIESVEHNIIRETLRLLDIPPQIELTALADIPAGTGLGSSSSFTTALIQALTLHQQHHTLSPEALAERACQIEIGQLREPIGKQDQYAAAFGGITAFTFCQSGQVHASPVTMARDTMLQLNDHLLLFFTGYSRAARSVLHHQHAATVTADPDMLRYLHAVKQRGIQSRDLLESGNISAFGTLLDDHWQEKRRRSPGMTTPEIDAWYDLAKRRGAIGGKLVGAGGGGCFLFCTESPRDLRVGLRDSGLQEIRYRFDLEGCKVLQS